jgi:hypothetical protein
MRLWQGSAQRVPLSPPLVPIKAILAKLDLKPQVQPGGSCKKERNGKRASARSFFGIQRPTPGMRA